MDYAQIYADFLKTHLKLSRPLKIVCDASNGTAGLVLKKLQNILDLELILINDTPDPEFSSHGPNPLIDGATDQASQKVIEAKANFGVIFDADADRAFFVDETGEVLPSFMTSLFLFRKNAPPYVADELVFKSLQYIGIDMANVFPSKIGSVNVKAQLLAHDASVGGEFSGHYYYKEFFGADSGILTMIYMANAISSITEPLSVFRASLKKHELVNEEIKLGTKTWAEIEPKVRQFAESENAKIETREGITLDTGSLWINIRTSNTEPILRLIGGGESKEKVLDAIEKLKALI